MLAEAIFFFVPFQNKKKKKNYTQSYKKKNTAEFTWGIGSLK